MEGRGASSWNGGLMITGIMLWNEPDNTEVFCPKLRDPGPMIRIGPVLDGFPPHMLDCPERRRFVPANCELRAEQLESIRRALRRDRQRIKNQPSRITLSETHYSAWAGASFFNSLNRFATSVARS